MPSGRSRTPRPTRGQLAPTPKGKAKAKGKAQVRPSRPATQHKDAPPRDPTLGKHVTEDGVEMGAEAEETATREAAEEEKT